ncbi:Uncharacterised protein [Chlamydia trachomatis]|nr:Uncharacterised protein [Chlamydia trachomatis]
MRFTGDCLGQQGLAGSGRTVEQNTTRNACANLVELVRRSQELADFFEFFDGLVFSGNVSKRDVGAFLVKFFYLGLGESAHHPRAGQSGHQEPEGEHQDQDGDDHL